MWPNNGEQTPRKDTRDFLERFYSGLKETLKTNKKKNRSFCPWMMLVKDIMSRTIAAIL